MIPSNDPQLVGHYIRLSSLSKVVSIHIIKSYIKETVIFVIDKYGISRSTLYIYVRDNISSYVVWDALIGSLRSQH
jgi:hypothetical protein